MSNQWTYIWMAYGATWVVLGAYYVSLRRRLRRAEAAVRERDLAAAEGRVR